MSTTIEQRGFTLVEVLVYAAGMVLLLGAIFGLLSYSYNWYGTARTGPRVDGVGITISDRLVKDIRSGKSIYLTNSSFNANPGSLGIASSTNSGQVIKKYALINGRITYQEDSGQTQYLSPSDITASRFYLTQLSTTTSKAVKFDLDLTYSTKSGNQTRTYSGVSILRNSY